MQNGTLPIKKPLLKYHENFEKKLTNIHTDNANMGALDIHENSNREIKETTTLNSQSEKKKPKKYETDEYDEEEYDDCNYEEGDYHGEGEYDQNHDYGEGEYDQNYDYGEWAYEDEGAYEYDERAYEEESQDPAVKMKRDQETLNELKMQLAIAQEKLGSERQAEALAKHEYEKQKMIHKAKIASKAPKKVFKVCKCFINTIRFKK